MRPIIKGFSTSLVPLGIVMALLLFTKPADATTATPCLHKCTTATDSCVDGAQTGGDIENCFLIQDCCFQACGNPVPGYPCKAD